MGGATCVAHLIKPDSNMEKYLIKGKTSQAVIAFDDKGILSALHFEQCDAAAINWLLTSVPTEHKHLGTFGHNYKSKVQIIPILEDLSFDAFWKAYAYKIGKKARAEKLWELMSEGERTEALKAIPRYKRWLASRQTVEQLYPETYLSQRRWENEFTV